jgi:hypothetical protein
MGIFSHVLCTVATVALTVDLSFVDQNQLTRNIFMDETWGYPVAETLRNFGGASAEGTSFLGGCGGMPPQKIFKIWTPEMAFAAF